MTRPGNLFPRALRKSPQLASLELVVQSTEVSVLALSAAHPALESDCAELMPIDQLAERVVQHAAALLDAIDRYRLLLVQLDRLDNAQFAEDDVVF